MSRGFTRSPKTQPTAISATCAGLPLVGRIEEHAALSLAVASVIGPLRGGRPGLDGRN